MITLPSSDGRQHRRRRVRRTQVLALEALKELRAELDQGVNPGRRTVAAHFDDWLKRQERSAKNPQTLDQYRWAGIITSCPPSAACC